jgi:hypothetical protein
MNSTPATSRAIQGEDPVSAIDAEAAVAIEAASVATAAAAPPVAGSACAVATLATLPLTTS